MRTIFTTEDIKNIVDLSFKDQDEQICLIDEYGEQKQVSIVDYLNISFYAWKNRLVNKTGTYETYDSFVTSMQNSLTESYALIEQTNAEVLASQDIDSATYTGKITFVVQTDKLKTLDYYCSKIRNAFLGVPQDIQNSYGEKIKAYIHFGILIFDEEPDMAQLGETLTCSLNFTISYLTEALNYADTKVEISLNNGETYYEMPYTKATFQNIFMVNSVPKQNAPALTGVISTAVSTAKTFAFYDFNKDLTKAFNDLFWRVGANAIIENGEETEIDNSEFVNIPVKLKITSNGTSYIYNDVIENMQKIITNSEFNISSISLKRSGK